MVLRKTECSFKFQLDLVCLTPCRQTIILNTQKLLSPLVIKYHRNVVVVAIKNISNQQNPTIYFFLVSVTYGLGLFNLFGLLQLSVFYWLLLSVFLYDFFFPVGIKPQTQ